MIHGFNEGKQLKEELLSSISNTANGKNASPEIQSKVLSIVRQLETEYPTPDDLLSNPSSVKELDGVWYLQYTSPSVIGEEEQDAWKAVEATEGVNIPTNQIQSKGSVSASGITVDTSNRVTKQIFDIQNSKVSNEIQINDATTVRVAGSFRVSEKVPIRAVVSFEEVDFIFENGFTLKLGVLFSLLALVRGTSENGWLETTFLDEEVRIGRGNKSFQIHTFILLF